MPIPENMPLLRLIEQKVQEHGGEMIGAVRTGEWEREDYWEKVYIIAWVIYRDDKADNYITHQANVNSEGTAMLVFGHYDMATANDAMADMLERANLTVGRV